MLRAARELLAVRSPLDAELMVSELLGTWWGQQPGRAGMREARRRRADIEELIGEGLVAYAAAQGSPAALALLSGIACLGTPRQSAQAEQAALDLMERGVARPGWADHVGAVEAAECYVNSDAFGDRDEVVCVFSYAGQEQHALVVVVDYTAGGLARDGWVTSQVGKLLEYCRESGSGDVRGSNVQGSAARSRPAPGRGPAGGSGRPAYRPSGTSAGQPARVVVDHHHQGVLLLAGVAEHADDLVAVAVGIGVQVALGRHHRADVLGPAGPGHAALHEGQGGLLGAGRLVRGTQAGDAG